MPAHPTRPYAAWTAGVVLACTALLAGCGEGTSGAGTDASATTSATTTTTSGSTGAAGTVTPSLPTPTGPAPSKTTPPPARDQAPPPRGAEVYARQFVTAWADGNTGRGELLATPGAHKQAFASTPGAAPAFDACEEAAASTVCTFTGEDYAMVVRVGTQAASAAEAHAVTDVRFRRP